MLHQREREALYTLDGNNSTVLNRVGHLWLFYMFIEKKDATFCISIRRILLGGKL